MNQNQSNVAHITHGLIDSLVGGIALSIFMDVVSKYQQWTTITQGEITILITITGLAAIFGMRYLASGLPEVVYGILGLYAETDSGKNFLKRFQKNETL